MIIKVVDAPIVAGGKAMMLCADSGEVLGKQVLCDLHQTTEGAELTVRFIVDGEELRFA
ncbi:hypothetical protein [Sphingomonas sp. T9W2]|uniref:hypothetical protein n=1 Tax=Sphingomonas sp. T9W2 TaxID=3143183 RepID=UPI0031F55ACA